MTDALELLATRLDVVDLLHAYCRAVDDNDPDAVAALFTQDCVYATSRGRNGVTRGRGAVAERVALLLSTFSATSHHVTNAVVTPESADRALSVCSLYAWHRFLDDRPDGLLWARYHDVVVRTADGWRIAERTLRVHGQQDFPFGWLPPEPPRGGPRGPSAQRSA